MTDAEEPTERSFLEDLPAQIAASESYDEVERFTVFVEQLDVAYRLLADQTLATARAALVGIDNLANLLLHAHAQRVFASGEGSSWYKRKRYTSRERKRILGSFDKMATLASRVHDGPSWRVPEAILSEADAAVMKVGHTYRNGVYHEDRHNKAILIPLTVLYAQAVGRAFCASQGEWSYSVDEERSARLAELGYETQPDDFAPAMMMLDFAAAARTITGRLAARFDVDEGELRAWLAHDIIERSARSAQIIAGLMQDGLPGERLSFVFFWTQFWEKHGADDEWLRLEERRDELGAALREAGADPLDANDPALVAYREAEKAHLDHGHRLQAEFEVSVTPNDPKRLAQAGERLVSAKDLASLLARYGELDKQVSMLEQATSATVRAWDALVQQSIDRQRDA